MSALSRSFPARLAISYAILLLLTMIVLGLALGAAVEADHEAQLRARLLGDARAVAVAAAPLLIRHAPIDETQPLIDAMGDSFGARVTLIAPDGTVWGDSE